MSSDQALLALIKTFADELPVGIWVAKAPSGEFAYANLAFKEIMGMGARADVAAGEYAAPYGIHGLDGELYAEDRLPFARALRARAAVTVDDIVIHRPDGGRVNIRAFAKPIVDAGGELTHVVIAFTDATREMAAEKARKEGEARLRHAQRMESVGNLAGGIAHDFNNILAVVSLIVSQLVRSETDPERREALSHVVQVAESGAQLTRQLLRFARRETPRMEHLSLNDVATAIAELLRHTVDRRIEVECEIAAETGRMIGDPSQVEQIVMNLGINARDAMPDGGRLVLRTKDLTLGAAHEGLDPGPYVALEVVDTGPGIPPSVRERIFEPYFTTKTSGSVRGTGLGLATAYGIARTHGGILEIAESSGHGTTMRALLPAADGASVRKKEPGRTHPPARPGEGTVLVVDDEPMLLAAAVRGLGKLGYRVLTATDGAEAVDVYREHMHEVGAVILDLMMPKMNGSDAYRAIRQLNPVARVLVTTGVDRGDGAAAPTLEGCAFLPKPYDVYQLSEALATLLTAS